MDNTSNHYNRTGLIEAILAALAAEGRNLQALTGDDLAPVDEIHVRGRKATRELADRLRLHPDSLVLDLGCGIGGAARHLTGEFGCSVVGIDLTFDYCRAAAVLGERAGFPANPSYLQGDATLLPFRGKSFDCVWTVHTAMNIADKARLYGEIHRVLKPGGTLAIYDILAGSGGPIHTPVPWASKPAASHLVSPDHLRSLLTEAGFRITSWKDTTEEGRTWFSRLAERTQGGAPAPVGMQLLFGDSFPEMARNQVKNLAEERIVLIECLAERLP